MKKVIILDHEPLSIRRKQIFYIEQLRDRGLDIEFWDCSTMFYPGMHIVDTIEETYRVVIDSLSTLQSLLEKTDIPNSVFIVETFDIWKNRKFFKLLSDKGCYKVRMELYANSVLPDVSMIKKILSSSPSRIIDALQNKFHAQALKFYRKIHNVKGYDTLICSGNDSRIDVRINHPDWEVFREIEQFNSDRPYAVFMDEYFPLHPDLQFFVKDFKADADVYQKAMRSFFNSYKEATGHNILVAVHPKSEYDGSEFGNCQCLKYVTASLVKGCQAAFMHSTSSLGFAIMADKPIALLSTNDYERTFALITHLKRLSNLTNLPIYNIDTTRSKDIVPQRIDRDRRENYIYSYLTSPQTQNLSNVDILFDFFSRLH